MKVSEQEAQMLLDAVREESGRNEATLIELRNAVIESRARRAAAVKAAMDAGIARPRIAEAAGVTYSRLYQILDVPET